MLILSVISIVIISKVTICIVVVSLYINFSQNFGFFHKMKIFIIIESWHFKRMCSFPVPVTQFNLPPAIETIV
jgi:hypothetical protein